MRLYLLYVASPNQIELTKTSLQSFHTKSTPTNGIGEAFEITHKSLDGLEICLHLFSTLEAISPHLRQSPVDLLIYDERGGLDALKAIQEIQADVENLAELWGTDFHFPLGRMVAILDESNDAASKTFHLGRRQVRDVLVAPKNIFKILRWIVRLLHREKENQNKVGMALSGGGLEGLLFQVGCLYAMELALNGKPLSNCDFYSGISSGSIAATILANDIPLKEVLKSFFGKSRMIPPLKASTIYDFAGKDIFSRIFRENMGWGGLDPTQWGQKIMRSIPTGFFKGDGLKNYISHTLKAFHKEDSFNKLNSKLFIGATHQDTFEHIVLGMAPWDNIRQSDAVRASCALPPVFTPCKINDQPFIDGQITKTCNLELLVKSGCNFIFIIDPLLPYTSMEKGSVESQGGFNTIIQTVKLLVHTRFKITLNNLTERYPDVDFLVLQPLEECAQAMSGSPMKFKVNTHIAHLAFKSTLRRLRDRHHVYSVKLAKYGFDLVSQKELMEIERKGIEV